MNKAIAFPIKSTNISLLERLLNFAHRRYRVQQCRTLTYSSLFQKTVSVIEDILETHSVKDRFYCFEKVDITIEATGMSLEISKAPNENVIAMLYREATFGQNVFSVVLNHQHGKITGIEYMTTGFCTNSEFEEQNGKILNPEVLIELLVSRSKLCRGKMANLKLSSGIREDLNN